MFLKDKSKNDNNNHQLEIIRTIYRYHNYNRIQTIFNDINYDNLCFFYFCEYDYIKMAKFYINIKKININQKLEYYKQNDITALFLASLIASSKNTRYCPLAASINITS